MSTTRRSSPSACPESFRGLPRYGMSLAETLAVPRIHGEEAEPAALEPEAGEAVSAALRKTGVQVVGREKIGDVGPRRADRVAWARRP
ncbi:MAG: hypothetical protein HY320_06450 [Armatimonadetes bacterium]|nr:hypothetical protein [Armatimonadota bacterium]